MYSQMKVQYSLTNFNVHYGIHRIHLIDRWISLLLVDKHMGSFLHYKQLQNGPRWTGMVDQKGMIDGVIIDMILAISTSCFYTKYFFL